MIIEGAFLKLPELLLGNDFPEEQYEATLINHFAMGVLLELNARNFENPMHRIHIEKPYPFVSKTKHSGRVDLFVDLRYVFDKGINHNLYGMKPKNWIEAKFFGSIGRKVGNQAKVSNTARIAADLFRLCLYVEEEQIQERENSRYLLLVFNRDPKEYLAFNRKIPISGRREWLDNLLQPGEKKYEISLKDEKKSFINKFGKIFEVDHKNLSMKLKTVNYTFTPQDITSLTYS